MRTLRIAKLSWADQGGAQRRFIYPRRLSYGNLDFVGEIPIFSAILTKSGKESAPIFRMSWARWTLAVVSLVPISAAICLLGRPETTRGNTSRSRGVSHS